MNSISATRSKMGLNSLPNNLEGLKTFYKTWCAQVPFDNILKTNTLFRNPGQPLPFTEPEEFFENWLESRTGATCWPHSKAIWALARACGFDARLAAGSMFDMGPANHATVIVHLPDGTQWILDNAFLTEEPLRLSREHPGRIDQGPHFAEVEYDGEEVYVHGTHPPMPGIFFHLLETDVPESFYAQQWTELSGIGPFNPCIHIRKNVDDEVITLRGKILFRKTASSMTTEVVDRQGIQHRLATTFGIGEELIEDWSESGAFDASVNHEDQMPPLPERLPPSKRSGS